MILVDSNVIIDVIERDPLWHDWSFAQIELAVIGDQVVINPVVIAEAAPRSGPLQQFENWLSRMLIDVVPLSNDAAYCAGQAFQSYRQKRKQGAARARFWRIFSSAAMPKFSAQRCSPVTPAFTAPISPVFP